MQYYQSSCFVRWPLFLVVCLLVGFMLAAAAHAQGEQGTRRDTGDWRWGAQGQLMDKNAWNKIVNRPRTMFAATPPPKPVQRVAPKKVVPKTPPPDPCAELRQELAKLEAERKALSAPSGSSSATDAGKEASKEAPKTPAPSAAISGKSSPDTASKNELPLESIK